MNLYFSDWSGFLNQLSNKGILHGGRIIKVYATEKDPREVLGRPNLFILQSDGEPFTKDEIFSYPERESYKGTDLEEEMIKIGLTEDPKKHLRALFRFANRKDLEACQYAMSVKENGAWRFKHPFEDLDGIDTAIRSPQRRSAAIHLDIFSPRSLQRLRGIVNIDQRDLI